MPPTDPRGTDGPDKWPDAMRDRIPLERRDELFFYAAELRNDADAGEWTVRIDPDDCLTGYDEIVECDPAIDDIADRPIDPHEEGKTTVYDGPVLLSAGVILCVDNRLVLFKRDADAPVDSLMWTSPAGRCDTTPTRTALTELYEELLVTADGQPAVIVPPDEDPSFDEYDRTLRRNGFHAPPEGWIRVEATVPSRFADLHMTVITEYGEERYVGEFWPFFDESSSTLELRRVLKVELPDGISSLRFADGEFDRRTAVLTESEIAAMDAEDLVATNRAFRGHLVGN